jgi:uncharacterized protein (TIGR02145 family)
MIILIRNILKVSLVILLMFFVYSCKKDKSLPEELDYTGQTGIVNDIEGNSYKTIGIGSQIWMSENLKTTKYNDGTAIPLVTDGSAWAALTTPAYCWYNNDEAANKSTYGALYNYFTVNTGKICLTGWHVPTDAQWTILTNYLINNSKGYQGSGEDIAKSLAASSGWETWYSAGCAGNDQTTNNSSGFSALPGGSRLPDGTIFGGIGGWGYWWSSTVYSSSAWSRNLIYKYDSVEKIAGTMHCGFSVRCIKDN